MSKYKWHYCSVGGAVRVKIDSGEDIAHLGELDQKMWTVLNCPTQGLEFDQDTLNMLDSDSDGSIKALEVIDAANWLASALKDRDILLKEVDTLPLDAFNTENETGSKLCSSAKQILSNLGLDKNEISLSDVTDSAAIFAKTRFNGDGIITETTPGTPELAAVIKDCIACTGALKDRSGADGTDAEKIETFYSACADYAAWLSEGKGEVLPYGADTAAAFAAVEAVKAKIEDYFMRCKLIAFNEDCAGAVDISVERIGKISEGMLSNSAQEIAECPIARPAAELKLSFNGINPAWGAAFASLKTLVLDKDFAGKDSITEDEWNATVDKFAPYTAWMAAKKGAAVEALGADRISEILKQDGKQALLELVAEDKALEAESNSIDDVNRLLHYVRDFYKLLKNFVILSDFYDPARKNPAIFEAGELYIDQRCCKLCIKVKDMGAHDDMASLSGMFLIYCKCTSRSKNVTMDIVALMTDGGTKYLRPGKNAIFYDRSGEVWDAVVTKIVDNPINIRQAFWRPYIKFWNFCIEKLNKNAAEKDAKAIGDLQNAADAPAGSKKQAFDIAKFAGIFAAIGLALGYIGQALSALIAGVKATPFWITLLVIVAIMLCISAPSCFIAWSKLRKRNLGPVLNANGWAINSSILVNIMFGATLTKTAKYPHVRMKDPYKRHIPLWKKLLSGFILAVIVAGIVLYCTDNLGFIGIHKPEKGALETLTEIIVEETSQAAAEIPAIETPAN